MAVGYTYPDTYDTQGVLDAPNVKIITWNFTAGETGTAIYLPDWLDLTVFMTGTFGGTVIMELSADGTTYVAAVDPLENAISMTAAGVKTFLDHGLYVRPRVSVGSVTAVKITLIGHKRM